MGYIVLNNQDTLKGMINLYPKLENYRYVQIRNGESIKTYFPYDVTEYEVGRKRYISQKIRVNISRPQVFLNVVFENDSIAFYRYKYITLKTIHHGDGNPNQYKAIYVEKPEFTYSKDHELYYVVDNGKRTRISKSNFRTKSLKIFSANDEIIKKIESGEYKFGDMIFMLHEHAKWITNQKSQ